MGDRKAALIESGLDPCRDVCGLHVDRWRRLRGRSHLDTAARTDLHMSAVEQRNRDGRRTWFRECADVTNERVYFLIQAGSLELRLVALVDVLRQDAYG